MKIGICDDHKKERDIIFEYCERFFSKNEIEHTYVFFSKGEEILNYCNEQNERIDLLFLDIEMEGISGIEVKDKVVKVEQVWRIVFVSSHLESMRYSFGTKTIGIQYRRLINIYTIFSLIYQKELKGFQELAVYYKIMEV